MQNESLMVEDRFLGRTDFIRNFTGVALVAFLTYLAEYMSFIVLLAYVVNKLVINFGLGSSAYALEGLASSLYLVLSGFIAIPIGHLADRFGHRRLTILGCLLGSAGLLSISVIDRINSLDIFILGITISLTVLGIGHGTYTATTLGYTGIISSNESYGKTYSLVEDAEFFGYAFGPATGAAFSLIYGRNITFEVSGFMLLTSAILAFFLMRNSNYLGITRNEQIKVSKEYGPAKPPSWKEFLRSFRNSIITLILLTTLVSSLTFSGFYYYVPLYAESLGKLFPILAKIYPLFSTLVAVTAVITMVPFGFVSDITQRRMPFLVIGLLIGSVSLLFAFFLPFPIMLVIASLIFGLSLGMTRVNQLAMLAERSYVTTKASIMGTNHAMEHIGYGLGALFGGVIIAYFGGFEATFRTLSVLLAIAALLFLVFAVLKKIK